MDRFVKRRPKPSTLHQETIGPSDSESGYDQEIQDNAKVNTGKKTK